MRKAKVEKVVIKNVFITFDGEEWDDYEGALLHEINKFIEYEELKIFTSKGLPTKEIDSACVVFFGTPRAAMAYIMLEQHEGYTSKGLDESSLGWYFWEENMWVDPNDRIEKVKKEVNETLKLCGGDPIE